MNHPMRLSSGQCPGLVLRAITAADQDNLRRWKNANADAFFHRAVITPEQQQKWFATYTADPGNFMLIIEQDDQPVGCLGFRLAGGSADIYNVILGETSRRRHGLMSGALRLLCSFLFAGPAGAIVLSVVRENTRAQAFYRKNGFAIVREEPDHYFMRLDPAAFASLPFRLEDGPGAGITNADPPPATARGTASPWCLFAHLWSIIFIATLLLSSLMMFSSDAKARYEVAYYLVTRGVPVVSGNFEALGGVHGRIVTYYDIGESLLLLPFVGAARLLAGDRQHVLKAAATLLQPAALAAALALLGVVMSRESGHRSPVAFPLLVMLGTPVLFFLNSPCRDLLIADGVLLLFLAVWQLNKHPDRGRWQLLFSFGYPLLGLIKVSNYAVLLPLALGYAVALYRGGRRQLVRGLAPLLVLTVLSLALNASYNYYRFGDIMQNGISERLKISQNYHGPLFAAISSAAVTGAFVSRHGLLVLCPLALACFAALVPFIRRYPLPGLTLLGQFAVTLLFHAALPTAGAESLFRYLLPAAVLLPFALLAVPHWQRGGRSAFLLMLLALTLAIQLLALFGTSSYRTGLSMPERGLEQINAYFSLSTAQLHELNPAHIDQLPAAAALPLKFRLYETVPPLWYAYAAQMEYTLPAAAAFILLFAALLLLLRRLSYFCRQGIN